MTTTVSTLTLQTGVVVGPQGPAGTTDYEELTNKPSTFPPSAHVHDRYAGFDTRADFVTWKATATGLTDGLRVTAGGLNFAYSTGARVLADLDDWLPLPPLNVEHSKTNSAPGTTEMTAAMHEMAAYATTTGEDLHMGPKVFKFDKSASGSLDVNGFTLRGAGSGRTIISSDTDDSGEAVKIRGAAGRVQGVTIKGYPFVLIASGTDLAFCDSEIECSDNASSDWESGIKIADTADVQGLYIERNHIHHVLLGVFSANNFGNGGNKIKGAHIRNNLFSNTRKTAISINSDFATSGATQPWEGVWVAGNFFFEYAGETSDRAIAVSFDNAADVHILDNVTDGYGGLGSGTGDAQDYAFHLENLGNRCIVTGNAIKNAVRGIAVFGGSAECIIANNALTGTLGRSDGDDVSLFADPTKGFTGNNGIYVVTNADGVADRITIQGNIVKDFGVGLTCGGRERASLVTGNIVSLCGVGVDVHNGTASADVHTNVIDQCKYAYGSVNSTTTAGVGRNFVKYCGDLFQVSTLSGGIFAITNAKITTRDIAVTGGANDYVDLFTTPSMIDCSGGRVTVTAAKDGSDHLGSAGTISLTYDGTTVTTTRDFIAPTSFVANSVGPAASNQFRDNSGTFQARLFTGGTSPTNDGTATAVYEFDGMIVYQA